MSFAVTAVAGTVISAYGAYTANQQANASRAQAGSIADRQMALQQAQFDWQKSRAEKEDRMRDQAMAPLWNIVNTPGVYGWGDIQSKTKGFFQGAENATNANMRNSGMLGSGIDAAAHQGTKLEEAKQLSQQWQNGLLSKADIAAKIGGAYNPNAAASLVRAPDWSNLSGMFMNQGNVYGAAAGQAAGNAMNNMAWLAQMQNKPTTTPTPGASIPTGGFWNPNASGGWSSAPAWGSAAPASVSNGMNNPFVNSSIAGGFNSYNPWMPR